MECTDRCGARFFSPYRGVYVCRLPKGHGGYLHHAHGNYRGYPYTLRWQGDYREEDKSFSLNEDQQMEFFTLSQRLDIPWTADFHGGDGLVQFFIPGAAVEQHRDALRNFMVAQGVEWSGGGIMELWVLRQRQILPLEVKIQKSVLRIREWYEHWEGKVYVAYSGGKDSQVLLHLVRSIYPDVPACFVNTGAEFPEMVRTCKTTPNCDIVRPRVKFPQVIEKYGYPVVSKEQAKYLRAVRETKSEKLRQKRLHGVPGKKEQGKIAERWKYLIDAPFRISERCCDALKKRPAAKYHKGTGRVPMVGSKASDSFLRQKVYLSQGCNAFENKIPTSIPLAFWTDRDIWDYIKLHQIQLPELYQMGYTNTGCTFCCFGVHNETNPNRFQRMRQTHPKLLDYALDRLGLRAVLDYMHIPYDSPAQQEFDFPSEL
jgi:3'-phosphoadenosine 5'-phosphosulfate sulfotransferase (PAPS reductase)/FAD synthetase